IISERGQLLAITLADSFGNHPNGKPTLSQCQRLFSSLSLQICKNTANFQIFNLKNHKLS
ncbi:MAG: hypothetical protein J6S65_01860, partial [Bacteroidaceae bacterium]|nr:hypothetical protein [Bacteroidaceae bacterium]